MLMAEKCCQDEEWKQCDKNYYVSTCGRVFSSHSNVILRPRNRGGYFSVAICNNGKRKDSKIHHLVSDAFIPNHEGKEMVDHIDRCCFNNHVYNLRRSTRFENTRNNSKFGSGVFKKYRKWVCRFNRDGNGTRTWKSFDTLIDCVSYRIASEIVYYGEYKSD